MDHILDRMLEDGTSVQDVDLLVTVAKQIRNKCLCPLGEFSITAVLSGVDKFAEDFRVPTQ
jgi:NADH:ubiquinone oxidoreductase subunit F (NADH-binding)